MPLVVEDGGGLSNADSYVSLADALAYHAARGNADWAGAASDTVREQALRRATAWLDVTFAARFPGYRVNGRDQALEWPRTAAYDGGGYLIDNDAVPKEVKFATYEAALREVETPNSLLAPSPATYATIKREQVGPIEREYGGDGKQASTVPVDMIEAILMPVLLDQGVYLLRA